MSSATESPDLISKVIDLCEAILEDPRYVSLMDRVDTFLEDDQAREQYRMASELGQELQQKQRMGIELGDQEVGVFERQRDALFQNDVISDFLSAQRELGQLQQIITAYVEKTIELGRIPEPEELENEGGGCCGGGGGGGCGCH